MLDVLDFAKDLVAGVLATGGVAIDATIGNGHDTLFLAERVGDEGHVFGFDVQDQAVCNTRTRLERGGMQHRVTLIKTGHESMLSAIPEDVCGNVDAVMFNLGYLPSSEDKTIITRPATTIAALDAALTVLRPEGIISIVLYTGHPGGAEETAAVEDWAAALSGEVASVLVYRYINQGWRAPYVVGIEKA